MKSLPEPMPTPRQELLELLTMLDDPVLDERLLALVRWVAQRHAGGKLPQVTPAGRRRRHTTGMVATCCMMLPQVCHALMP